MKVLFHGLNQKLVAQRLNPFQPSVTFHIETNNLFYFAKQMIGFYMKRNTGLKLVFLKLFYYSVFPYNGCIKFDSLSDITTTGTCTPN